MPLLSDGEIFEVELLCEPRSGCGITIVGSRSSGIAIKTLIPGGIADQDGRLQEGDKIISIDGRQAWCLTCGQVARCLRQNDSVLLGIHRPDRYDRYDYVDRSLYCGSRRVSSYRDSVSSASPRSTTSSTSSYSQDITDVEEMSQTLSTDFDASTNSSNMASCSTSPSSYYTSCSDLNLIRKCTRASPAISGSSSMDMQQKPKRHSVAVPLSVSYYNVADKWRRLVRYFSRQSDDDLSNEVELTLKNKPNYQEFLNSPSACSSIDLESSHLHVNKVFRKHSDSRSVDELVPPGLYID